MLFCLLCSIMLLFISLLIALVFGLTQPFAARLRNTGLWLGRVLTPAEAKEAFPQGIQDAVTAGWPSTYYLIIILLPYGGATVGFFYSWWGGVVSFIAAISISIIAGKTDIASKKLERYIAVFAAHAADRVADFSKKGDVIRANAAIELKEKLQNILLTYMNSDIAVPTEAHIKVMPFGEPEYLIDSGS
jgi:hypothetical protein